MAFDLYRYRNFNSYELTYEQCFSFDFVLNAF
jgi:hypothetical protein